ncbi:immunoglobulin-like domain-containing protein [Litchfieldia salsa]|uniref:Anchor n=1 Tax=Litchfieldia salsa TaxID=930152 RepID=A0A1H0WB84_9BACI|nr:immunoglobulin-like domain-containing protein [Litchfieldia salsa]SDP87715.1 anchor [Litchfieldia salsa]
MLFKRLQKLEDRISVNEKVGGELKVKRKKKMSVFLLTLLFFNTLSGFFPQSLLAEEQQSSTPELILHYDMKSNVENGDKIMMKDVSGSNVTFDGEFKNPENGQLIHNDEVGYVSFNGGSSTSKSGYIEIPKSNSGDDLLSGVKDVTISALVNWTNDGQNRWIFGLGTVTDDAEYGNKYFFITPRHGSGDVAASGISQEGWRNESLVKSTAAMRANEWEVATVVFSETSDTITLYVNGKKVASGSAGGKKLEQIIDPSASFSGFIGKSIFKNDPFFKGLVSDYRVYNGAMSDSQVGDLFTETSGKITKINQLVINDSVDSLDLIQYLDKADKDLDHVTKNIALPMKGKHGVDISWTSSNPVVISNDGKVTRPNLSESDAEVELTATLSYKGYTVEKKFNVTVLMEFSDQNKVEFDKSKLSLSNINNVKGNITLPVIGEHGSSITWESSNTDIIKGSSQATEDVNKLGWVTRPKVDTNVKLTATLSNGSAKTTKEFNLTVKKDPGKLDYEAYFFSYFTGEYEGGEEISFATAEDPLNWRALNNGQSVIQSKMGEKGLRDPFIIRAPEGDKFYMLATDLKMGASTNFDQAQITGSHYMMIWESEDLVNWSEQRMVEVAPKTGGNTWAPEAIYDKNTGQYVVFWASSMKNSETYGNYPNGRPAGQYNVMYYATTRDFITFSEPKVFIDEGFPTIDTSFVEDNGTFYRFTKSEVNYRVYYEKATDILFDKDGIKENGFQFDVISGTKDGNRGLIGHQGNNEGQTIFKDIHEEKWYMFLDSWPYHVRWSSDLEDGTQFVNNLLPSTEYALPPGPRHGTVIPITRAEYDALQTKYGMTASETSEEPVVHYSFDPENIDGTTVKDLSDNGFDAKLIGGSQINTEDTVGKSTGAVELDGTGYVELPENLIKDLNLESMTMSTWVNVQQNQANQRIFDFSSNTGRITNRNTMYLSTQGDSGNLEFAIVTPFTEKFGNQSTLLASSYKYALRAPVISTAKWHHVAMTIEGFDAVLYVDGKEVSRSSTYNVEPRMLLETSMNYLGKSSNENHSLFKGKFDDFRIYNRALDAEEVASLADEDTTVPPVDQPEGIKLILDYEMNNIDGTKVVDNTGNFEGKLVNPQNAQVINGEEVGVINFKGGSSSSYIEMPQGVLNGLESVTVSSLVNWNGKNEAEWIFGLGQDNNKYLYATPKRNSGDRSARLGLGVTSWRDEAGANATTGALKANEWKLVTSVVSAKDQTLRLFIDGVEVSSVSTNGYTLEQINNVNGRSGFIGKSFYTEDPYFGGMIADFEVYDGALTSSEITKLKEKADEKIANMEDLLLQNAMKQLNYETIIKQNENKDNILTDLSLPKTGASGTTISWESDNQDIITNEGKVIRPSYEDGDKEVTLTATVSDGRNNATKEFKVIVLKKPHHLEAVKLDAQDLKVYNINDVRGHLTLPDKGLNGSKITWKSSDSSIISITGEVNRPAHGEGNQKITLTAIVSLGDETVTKPFQANVKEMPKQEKYEGYVFSYFTGEGTSNGEQIYFSLSEGNDPLKWQELNNGNPAITSTLGEKGLRDPFIIRSPEGDKFYMIATDLKINGSWNWDRAQRSGSRSIMVWESNDLVNWSEQRMAEVAPPEAGNTWAPEIFYDDTTGEYIVFWASKLYDNEEHTGSTYNKMMYSKTRDFYTFTEPKVYIDAGYSVIDTTMIQNDGKVYRLSKDERNNTTSSPNGKFIFQEVGDSVLDPNFQLIKEGIGKGSISAGEGPTIFKSNTEEKWYMFIDEFGGRGYVPFETTDLDSGEWVMSENYDLPAHPRHGTVIPVTKSEHEALLTNVPAVKVPVTEQKVTSVTLDKETMELIEGKEGQLNATVTPEDAVNKETIWSTSNEEVVKVDRTGKLTAIKEGRATISVSTVDGGYMAFSEVVVKKATDSETPIKDIEVTLGEKVEVSPLSTVIIKNTGTKIKLPSDLPVGTKLSVEKAEPGHASNQGLKVAGDLYSFTFTFPAGSENYTGNYQLIMGFAGNEFSKDKVAIYYLNEKTNKWEHRGGVVNEQDQTITLNVPHFSTYGVFVQGEVPGDDNGNPGDGSGTPGDGNGNPGNDNGAPGDGNGNPGNDNGAPGDGNGNPGNDNGTPGDSNGNPGKGNGAPGNDKDKPGEGKKTPGSKQNKDRELPNTATNLYNYLILGTILLAIGGVSLQIINRKKKRI